MELNGEYPQSNSHNDVTATIISMLSQEDIPLSMLWDLDSLGIRDPMEQSARDNAKKSLSFILNKQLNRRMTEGMRSI